jgi:hypothetical protein
MREKSIKVKAAALAVLMLALGSCANTSPPSSDNANSPQQVSKPYTGY